MKLFQSFVEKLFKETCEVCTYHFSFLIMVTVIAILNNIRVDSSASAARAFIVSLESFH